MKIIPANGANIPAIGFGTWTLDDKGAAHMVAKAVEAGYRHIDTAAMYQNEAGVGEGLKASGIARGDVFVTTKIWHDQIGDGALQASLERSLDKLGLDHVDLALIHWPSKVTPLAESVAALNDAKTRGMARHIGVSNFTIPMIEEASRLSDAPLACNQIEYHPLLDQDRVIAACRTEGMAVTAYCPLARGAALFADPAVAGPAAAHGVGPAQIILRWHMQQDGVVAIPRTSKPERLAENADVFGFELSEDEMAAISALRVRGHRICDFEFATEWDAA